MFWKKKTKISVTDFVAEPSYEKAYQKAYEELCNFVIDNLRDSSGELISEKYGKSSIKSDPLLLKGVFLRRLIDGEKEKRRLMSLAKQVEEGQKLLKKYNSKVKK
jgi:hypothetical protein